MGWYEEDPQRFVYVLKYEYPVDALYRKLCWEGRAECWRHCSRFSLLIWEFISEE